MPRKDIKPRQRLDAAQRTEAILAAAEVAFHRQPYGEVSLAGIAADAGASEALVYRYFSSKAELYAQVVRADIDDLMAAQGEAIAALNPRTPVREKIRAALEVYLDRIAANPQGWAGALGSVAEEPLVAADVRVLARTQYVDLLAAMLRPSATVRHGYSLWGYFGFVEAASLRWVRAGCPPNDRGPLVQAALGALEGALGDWAA